MKKPEKAFFRGNEDIWGKCLNLKSFFYYKRERENGRFTHGFTLPPA